MTKMKSSLCKCKINILIFESFQLSLEFQEKMASVYQVFVSCDLTLPCNASNTNNYVS